LTSLTAAWRASRAEDHVRYVFGLLLIALWLVVLVMNREVLLGEPDLQWHIKTGEWIWQNAAVPTADPFSFTFAGEPWIAKEWLSQLLFFWTYAAGGWNGVMLLSLLALAAGAGVLYGALSRDLAPMNAALACILGLLLASASFTVRPHLLTLALFIIWTHQLFAASRSQRAPHFGLLLLIVLWANLHAAFTIGFVIAFFAFLDFIERTKLERKDVILKWIAFLGLCPLVTMFHPYLWDAILATWTVVGPNEAVLLVREWQPFNAQEQVAHHAVLLGLVFLALVTGFRLGIAKALLIILLLHLYLTHVRYAFFVFPILVILVAPDIAQQFPRASAASWRSQLRDPVEKAMSDWFRPLAGMLAGALILLAVLQGQVLPTAPGEKVVITRAIAYAKANNISGNVMNAYNLGGALIFSGIPSFIDGRTDQLFLGDFVKRFAHGPKQPDELARALQDYNIKWTVFTPTDPRAAMLDRIPGWRLAYRDEHAVIHRRGEEPRG